MSAMLVRVLVLLICVACSYAEVVVKCIENAETNMTLTPSEDGLPGRYTAKWCSSVNPTRTKWRLDLWYYERGDVNKCPYSLRGRKKHSTIIEIIEFSCENVCLFVNFDLVFTGCFGLESTLYINESAQVPQKYYKYIKNNYTMSTFENIVSEVIKSEHDNDITLHCYLGIPLSDIKIELCETNNNTAEQDCSKYADSVANNCSVGKAPDELTCVLVLPHGFCYKLYLEHDASWTSGLFNNKTYIYHENICRSAAGGAVAAGGRRWALWAAAALLGGALLAAAARLACAARARARRKLPLATTSVATAAGGGAEAEAREGRAAAAGAGGDILLLYARDGPLGAELAAALRELLQHACGCKVHDVFSPETMCAAATAPNEWVRRAVGDGAVRLVLLDTPAVALLQPAPAAGALPLQEPLLGRRAVYRKPEFGDGLVQYALRLLAEGPQLRDYRRCFLVCVEGVGVAGAGAGAGGALLPFARYELPGALPLLLRALAPAGPRCAARALRLRAAAAHFASHVAAEPAYLAAELLVLD